MAWCRSRAGSLLAVLAGAILALAVFVPPVFAATTFSNITPADGSVVSMKNPLISIKATDLTRINPASRQMKIDGASVVTTYSTSTYALTINYRPTALTDGTHTVWTSVTTYGGVTTTYQWSFRADLKPTIGPVSPLDGSTVTTQTPMITGVVAAKSGSIAAWGMRLDGEPVGAVYNASTGVVGFVPASPLRNGVLHTASIAVTDTAGLSAVLTWTFRVQVYTDMSQAGSCVDCHTTFPASHPMTDCLGCHGPGSPVGEGWNVPSYSEHSSSYIGTASDCTNCHTRGYLPVPEHPSDLSARHASRTDVSGCDCHDGSLTIEHERRVPSSGGAFTCATCHSSTNASVKAAIAASDTACEACHAPVLGGGHEAAHETQVATATLAGTGSTCGDCHSGNLMIEHAKSTASSASSGCGACHPTLRAQIVTLDPKTCVQSGCHTSGSSKPMHAGESNAHALPAKLPSCLASGCHAGSDLAVLHSDAATTEGVIRRGCLVCHPNGTIPASGDCASCHDMNSPHPPVQALHTVSVAETGSVPVHLGEPAWVHCTNCHSPSLLAIHENDCAKCHASSETNVRSAIASWNGKCEACHSTFHATARAAHDNLWAQNTCSPCHGGYGPWQQEDKCYNCHLSAAGLHAASPNLTITNGSARMRQVFSSTGANQSFTVPAGVTTVSVDAYGAKGTNGGSFTGSYYSPGTVSGGFGGRVETQLAVTPGDVLTLRVGGFVNYLYPQNGQGGWPNGGAPNGDAASTSGGGGGSSSILSGSTILLEAGGGGGGGSLAAGAGSAGGAVGSGAGGNAAGGAGTSYGGGGGGGWNGGAGGTGGSSGGRGGTSYIRSGVGTITAGVQNGSGSVVISWTDALAPATTSNAKQSYAATAVIDLAASDLGGSGLKAVRYRVDSGVETSGIRVTVPGPGRVPTSASHTLTYYSIDNAGNAETAHVATFAISGDATAPVTTSNLKDVFYGTANISLTATDAGGSGVAGTRYSLDGASVTSGTAIVVGAPASGETTHSIVFWSVDNMGNAEAPHTVAFSVRPADGTLPVTTTNAQASYVGTATIALSSSDTGSGIDYTHYRLDGGAETSGSLVTATGTAVHSLEYWSVDRAGNVEIHKTVYFDVVAGGALVTARTFSFTGGEQSFTVPDDVTLLSVDLYGGQGGAGYNISTYGLIPGGFGGGVHALVPVTPGSVLRVITGGAGGQYYSSANTGGYPNGGGGAQGGGGGGSSVLALDSTVLVEAGGGAGGGYWGGGRAGGLQGSGQRNSQGATGPSLYGGGGGGWNGGAVAYGGTSLVAVGTGGITPGARQGAGLVRIAWYDSTAPSTTSDASGSYVGPVSIHLTASDPGGGASGVASTRFSLDGGAWVTGTTIDVPSPAWSQGTQSHTLRFYSSDRAGNVEGTRTVSFTVAPVPDLIAPVTVSDAKTSYVGTATITLSASDAGGSGLATTYYDLDGNGWVSGTAVVVPEPEEGVAPHELRFYSIDRAGNAEAVQTLAFDVVAPDRTPPVTTSDAASQYVGLATITLVSSDDRSGIDDTYYILDGADPVAGTTVLVAEPPYATTASHTLTFWSVDGVGNREEPRSVAFTVGTAPDTTSPVTESDAQEAYVGAATITLDPGDSGGSGVASVHWMLDGGQENEGTAVFVDAPPFGGDPEVHTLDFWAVDGAGNIEAAKAVTFTVAPAPDDTAPTTTSDYRGGYNGTATITFAAIDTGGSGVAATYYSVDGEDFTAGTSVDVAPPDSGVVTHHFQFYSVDNAGNAEAVQDGWFDSTNVLTTLADAGPFAYEEATITLQTSGDSGSKWTQYRLDGADDAREYTGPFRVYGSGEHTLEYWTSDLGYGTEEEHRVTTFTVLPPAFDDTHDIRVRVTQGGQPAQDVDVVICTLWDPADPASGWSWGTHARTDADGYAVWPNMPGRPGGYRVRVVDNPVRAFYHEAVEGYTGDVAERTLDLNADTPEGYVHITVRDAGGAPVIGVRAWAEFDDGGAGDSQEGIPSTAMVWGEAETASTGDDGSADLTLDAGQRPMRVHVLRDDGEQIVSDRFYLDYSARQVDIQLDISAP